MIVSKDSGVNDYLDRDGSRTPIDFPCGLGLDRRIDTQVVQAATKWKRMALKQFDCKPGEGICTDACAKPAAHPTISGDPRIAARDFIVQPRGYAVVAIDGRAV